MKTAGTSKQVRTPSQRCVRQGYRLHRVERERVFWPDCGSNAPRGHVTLAGFNLADGS